MDVNTAHNTAFSLLTFLGDNNHNNDDNNDDNDQDDYDNVKYLHHHLLLQLLHPSTPFLSSIKPPGHSFPSSHSSFHHPHPSIHACIHPSIHACMHPFMHASIHSCMHPPIHPSITLTHLVVSTSPTANPSGMLWTAREREINFPNCMPV